MKKYFYSLLAAATMLFATTSCTDEEIVDQSANEVNVSFTVQTNGTTASRAIANGVEVGKGNMADKLIYAVYENGNSTTPKIQNVATETKDGEFSVTIPLAKNIAYDIVFFAYNEAGNVFGITADNARTINLKELKLNTSLEANKEAYDAFFKTLNGYTPKAGNTTVMLNRPFAQLNAGTTLQDLADAADLDVEITNSQIVVKKAHNKFNAFTGEATGEEDLIYASTTVLKTIGEVAKQTSKNGAEFEFTNETFNVKGKDTNYYYLALAYVLACNEKELYDVDVTFYRDTDDEVNTLNIPYLDLQRNYRTNIIGNLLTSKETFEVVIDDVFADKEYNYTVWGGGVKEVTPDDNGVYNIALAEELAWIAQQVNSNANNFENKIVKLVSDIDLKNIAWTPIGTTGDAQGFKGTFDGNGKIISNLYVDLTAKAGQQAAGLFASANDGIIKNFTIQNAVIKNMTTLSTSGTAVVLGSSQYGITVDGVNVKNAIVEGNRLLAGIVGYFKGTVTNCLVDNIELKASPDDLDNNNVFDNGDKVGGIVANVNGSGTISDNKVNNFTILAYRDMGGIVGGNYANLNGNRATNGTIMVDQTVTLYDGAPKDKNAGELVGRQMGGSIANDNTYENVTIEESIRTIEALQAAINAAADDKETIISIQPGTYVTSQLTIAGAKKNVKLVAAASGVEIKGQVYINNAAKVTLKELTLNNEGADKTNEISVMRNNAVSIINGQPEVTIEDCTFNLTTTTDGSGIRDWWSTGSYNEVTVKNCVFNCNGQRAMQLHEYVDVQGCTFNEPYRYVLQINSASETTVVWKNNHIEKHTDNGKPAYHIQLTNGGSEATKATANKTFDLEGNTGNVTVDEGYIPFVYETNAIDATTMKGDFGQFVEIIDNVNGVSKKQDGSFVAYNATGLQYAIDNVKENGTVYINDGIYSGEFDLTHKNITLQKEEEKAIGRATETTGAKIDGMVWLDDCTVTIKGLTLTNSKAVQHPNPQNSQYFNTINAQYPVVGAYNKVNVTFEDCTFDLVDKTVYGFYGYAHNSPVFKNCTFNCNKIRPIASNGPSLTVTGCTFNNQYHYSVRIFENSAEKQTIVYTNNTVTGSNDKGEFEGINISKKGGTATVLADFTIKGNTTGLKYRHHKQVTMSESCTYDTDIEGFVFEKEQ